MNPNKAFLNSFVNVSEETFAELEAITNYIKVPAGTELVGLGDVPSKIYLLVSGVVRCYLTTESGKEFNKSFYLPTCFFASLTALIKKSPSIFVFETITDCKIYEIDYYKFRGLCKSHESINTLYSKVLEEVYMKYENRLVELISLDAKDRYFALLEQTPNIDELIPQYHIASYLGITPVQLSRIRKKIEDN
ncbi:Crp/Fnr family transcriptional regulator [Seonamhaeicola sediminis]|uniref:Crp/Fnr family transcriptional regulator n=1 Tax=Seonamhaeicola sediminis TaxID=2528206 RepID=A0A562YE35_9FLAO|nr:Crp/Fnr family transcriptional regulator [Seonamhaeicola sediminis]TWO32917.1 Crp/Fnr family transcriptional regulator [Seonamhaeicola sediminis]